MSTLTYPLSSESSIAISLDSLASNTFVESSAVDLTAVDPQDAIIRVSVVTTGTAPSTPFRVQVYVKVSLDGTTYSTGPSSGTSATDEPDLYLIGSVPCNSASTTHTRSFSLLAAIGFIPEAFKLVCRNELGTALSTGCSAGYVTVTPESA